MGPQGVTGRVVGSARVLRTPVSLHAARMQRTGCIFRTSVAGYIGQHICRCAGILNELGLVTARHVPVTTFRYRNLRTCLVPHFGPFLFGMSILF